MVSPRQLVILLMVVYFAGSKAVSLAHAGDRLTRIQERGQLAICIWPDYYAISYRNPRTGDLQGIDIDMAHALANDLGVDPQFIESSFAQLVDSMQNDGCDIAMHAVGITPQRANWMAFSEPHLRSGFYGITTKDHPVIRQWADIDQPGIVVSVLKGTVMEPVMNEHLSQATLSVVDDLRAREQEVMSGRADVFITDYPYGKRMVELTDWAALIEPPRIFAATDYGYAVPLNEPLWLARVNQFVATVKADGRLRAAAERHGLVAILAP